MIGLFQPDPAGDDDATHTHDGGTGRAMDALDGRGDVRGDGRACGGGRSGSSAAGSESPHGAGVLRERPEREGCRCRARVCRRSIRAAQPERGRRA
ncbi:hypothetical protein EMIT0158MI4_100282 [Burkholderia ambifaria]